MKRSAIAAVALISLLGCEADRAPQASHTPEQRTPTEASTPTPSEPPSKVRRNPNRPPPVVVTGDETVVLEAWTYCFGNLCVDGAPPSDPADVGAPEQVTVTFPLPDWRFDATFTEAGKKCARDQRVPLEPTRDGEFLLRPAGRAGTYDVTLFGRGEGDLFTTFRWTTPIDGPLPKPKARMGLLSHLEKGEETSYGIELEITNLETTPKKASARITVRSKQGNELSFRAKLSPRGCFPEGTLYFDRPDDVGARAAELGDRPFTYEVKLALDGKRYFARATWPNDQIPGNHPSVRLEFSPSLPSLSG